MYDPNQVKAHYDAFGAQEWERLDTSAHARLIHHLHKHFLEGHIGPGKHVLDAGCGAGRFAVDIARSGSTVTLLDISEIQLALAREKLSDLGLLERTTGFLVGDISDLSALDADNFDTTICYGGALNYLFELAEQGVRELVRVTKPGGTVLVSVMSRWGVFRFTVARERLDPGDFFGRPDYWHIPQVAETGDLAAHPEVRHPPRHLFDAVELRATLENAGLENVELASTPSISAALYDRLDQIERHPTAWNVILALEERAYRLPGLNDSGEHMLAKGRVPG